MTDNQLVECLKRTSDYIGNKHNSKYYSKESQQILAYMYGVAGYPEAEEETDSYKHIDREPRYKNPSYPYKESKIEDNEVAKATSIYKKLVKNTSIAVALIVTLNFGYITISNTAKAANETINNMMHTNDTLKSMVFTDYDNLYVTGGQIMAAYDSLKGKECAIIVNQLPTDRSENQLKSKYYTRLGLNYNALVEIDKDVTVLSDNRYYSESLKFKKEQDEIQFNTNDDTRFTLDKVVRINGKYHAMLLEDGTNNVIGIVFQQC